MGEPTFEYKNRRHGANFSDLRENWCDITITVNDTKYRAHKIILAANLKYFKTRLSNSSEDSEGDVIDMTAINVTDLAAFISYAYTGKILVTIGNVLSLIVDAHRLNEDVIKENCIKFVNEHLKEEDAFLAYKIADTIGSELLRRRAATTIIKNFKIFSQTTGFLDLNYESLERIFCVADSDCKPQQIVFEGIMRWIMHNVQNRWTHTNDLLSLIDLTKLDAEYIMNYLGNIAHNDLHGIVKDIVTCYHTSKLLKQKQNTLLVLQAYNNKTRIQLYDLIGKKWSSIQEIFFSRSVGSLCDSLILNDKIYFIDKCGACKLDFTTELISVIISRNNTLWKSANYNLCACDKFLYLRGIEPNQLLRYDPQTFSFGELAPSELKMNNAGAAIFNEDSIHVLGRTDELRTAFKYDPVTNKWMQFPSMREERRAHAVAVLDGKLYACGGRDTNSAEVYEPATNCWRLIASMKQKRHSFLLVGHDGKLWAIGGDDKKSTEVYDPSKDQWQIDKEASSGLQLEHPTGGLISDKCIQHNVRALKRFSEPTNKATSDTSNNNKEVQPPSKKIKK